MQGKSFRLPSFAKINLFLRVLGKRADGFHEICTIFQTVSLCDHLTFSECDRILLSCDNERIPTDDGNLIVKAAKLLQERYAVKKGAAIYLEKNIPAPGGLGGGSSNAATAIFGLMRLWEIEVDSKDLQLIGEKLGSDVPFFFAGGTGLGTGRGTEISSLADFREKSLLIVTPNVDVSTKDAFARLHAPDLTNKGSKSILQICRDDVNSLYSWQSTLENDFERVIFEIEPEIRQVKEKLVQCGAKSALLSGSGASVFGIFETDEQRQDTLKMLSGEKSWRVFPTETVSRLAYQTFLGLDEDFA
jgi:4-diphosphocytidyl-2-C-methyl-D-erythritol kinase